MKKKTHILLTLFLVSISGFSQDNFYVSQYFQVSPIINPSFTGIDNFMDIKINYRNQWGGFTDAPSSNYLSINGYFQKGNQQAYKQYTLRTSNPFYLDSLRVSGVSIPKQVRHGLGGNIIFDVQGPYEQIAGYLNYALHLPISVKSKLSLGVAAKISNHRIDFEKLILQNPDNDNFYQSLIAAGGRSTFLSFIPGLSIYGDRYYISYAAKNLVNTALSSDEALNDGTNIEHVIMAGYKILLGSQVHLLPSVLMTQSDEISNLWDANIKVLIKERTWAGLSYRNRGALVFMAGIYLNNIFNLSYSYDYVTSELNNYTNGSHEIILGLMLFKKDTKAPFLW